MITLGEASALVERHLGRSLRARHSIFVGFMMGHLAKFLDGDAELWEITGICHDLDFEETRRDPGQHGLLAAEWLQNDLPPEALTAIQAHDHRTGVVSETRLADILKLADAVAVGEMTVGRPTILEALTSPDPRASMSSVLAERPYLPEIILSISRKRDISLASLADIARDAPSQ